MTDENAVVPSDWTMEWDNGVTYPFVEDENANITGLGHQDAQSFAEQVNHYDEACMGDPFHDEDLWTADHVSHRWAVLATDGERLLARLDNGEQVSSATPGALAITTLWGQR